MQGDNVPGKVVSVEKLRAIREDLRRADRTVVQCHGCFDIVHPGHIRYLRFAREQGDVLIVSVSADDVVAKGTDRPYINQELRLENLAELECVDYVCLDHNTWAGPVLETLQPDIYIKGREYEDHSDPRFVKEKELVEAYGGKVIFSSGDVVYSSTHILRQFRDRFPLEGEKIRFFCQRYGITRTALERHCRELLDRRVLVLGDPIMDRYVHCDALGIAAESPVLSVTPIREEEFLAAGGLIATQVVSLGGKAGFVTVLGRGTPNDRFAERLEQSGVALHAVRVDQRPVFVKTRYLVEEKKVFKVDSGRSAPLSTSTTQELIRVTEQQLHECDALVVTDSGYGLLGHELVEGIIHISQRLGKPYFADVGDLGRANILRYKNVRLATPSEAELRYAFADNESGLASLAARYYRATHAEGLVLTMSKRGLIYFHAPAERFGRLQTDYLPAFARHPIDPVGAGDVFLAGAVLSELANRPTQWGIYLASCLAALHINHLGNEPVRMAELQEYLSEREELAE